MQNTARASANRRAIAVGLVVASTMSIGGVAVAQQAYPTQAQVDQAKANVAAKQAGVNAIQAKFQQAQAAADAAQTQAEVAAEAYNLAMVQLDQANQQATASAAAAARAAQTVADQRGGIANLVAQSYQDGQSFNALNAVLGAQDPSAMLTRTGVVNMAGQSMKVQLDHFVAASTAADAAKAAAADAAKQQQAKAAAANAARGSAASAAAAATAAEQNVAQQRTVLVQQLAAAQNISIQLASQRQAALEAIARAQAAAAARAAAAQRAAAAAAAAAKGHPSSGGTASQTAGGSINTAAPAPSGAIAQVIAFAKSQLGKPYVWGGAGPNVWDCSGLTMMAFKQVGINLYHYAAYQYQQGTPISMAQAQPGDLLFWSTDGSVAGIHHVAIYLGNNTFIEAPHTGANVRYNSLPAPGLGMPDFVARM